jgi:flagellar biosynthesis GTPase FlhF
MASLLSYGKASKSNVVSKPTIQRTTPKPSQPVPQPSVEDELRTLTKTISGIMASGSDRIPSPPKQTEKIARPEIKNRIYRSARVNETEKPAVVTGQARATAVKTVSIPQIAPLEQMENHLVDSGLDSDVIKLLLQPSIDANHPATSFQELRTQVSLRLNQIVNTSPIDELLQSGVRAAVLLGPTGVGKTTTIAKLAARAILKYGRKVVLVTLDTYRIGAIKQLGTYAEIIGVPLKVAKSISEVEAIISSSPKDALVLIDTVGRSAIKLAEMSDTAEYFRNESQIRKYLVLSATTNTRDNMDIAAHFDVFGIDRNIITKTDETIRYGTMINYLARLGRTVDYITTGQNVPEDIRTAGDETITDLLFDGLN